MKLSVKDWLTESAAKFAMEYAWNRLFTQKVPAVEMRLLGYTRQGGWTICGADGVPLQAKYFCDVQINYDAEKQELKGVEVVSFLTRTELENGWKERKAS